MDYTEKKQKSLDRFINLVLPKEVIENHEDQFCNNLRESVISAFNAGYDVGYDNGYCNGAEDAKDID